MVTIKDIAKLAGVSFSTVSKALNDSPLVTKATKRKVLAIAEQLSYTKNSLAAQLASGRSGIIGIIWREVDNPVYASMAMQLHQAFHEKQYEVVLTMSPPIQGLDLFERMRLDGMLIWDAMEENRADLLHRLGNSRTPALLIGSDEYSQALPTIQVDRKAGMRKAVQYLFEQGHRRISLIGSRQRSKVDSFLEAAGELGLSPTDIGVIPADLSWESGYAAAAGIEWDLDAPTAVIGANNLITRGALQALLDHDRQVPEQVSLLGYDDLPEMSRSSIPLTTVGPFLQELVTQSVQRMLALIEKREWPVEACIVPDLHVRSSVRTVEQ